MTENLEDPTENEVEEDSSPSLENSSENITGREAEENVTEGLTGNAVQKELPEKAPENLDKEKDQEVGSGGSKDLTDAQDY